jgi:type II secretory pathway component PulC
MIKANKKMKKTLLLITFLAFFFSGSVYANEVKCKFYNVICKTQKFASDTKEYQIKEWEKSNLKVKKKQKK